ncbi:MAG: 3-hydroxyacyl-CoA dehydrogenase [Chloroflexi bacterium]|nr:3-hydroxyacyl-CoA dehydrogenase [Chloroflexota bacterium]
MRQASDPRDNEELSSVPGRAGSTEHRANGALGVVGVVGTGTMGAGIAQVALEAGHEVVLHDVDEAALDGGRARIREGLQRRAARRDHDGQTADRWIRDRYSRLRVAVTLDALAAEAELVIEAALEDLELKRTIFRALDAVAPPDTILATNTSAIPVGAIAQATSTSGRVVGLHFFNPAPLMGLVEVVVAATTEPAVGDRVEALMRAWGKTPVRGTDTPGFIVNRVNRPFTLEALAILADGLATVGAIDGAMREAGFPMGPFELMDFNGIEVTLAATRAIFEARTASGDPLADRFRPSAIQEQLVESGRLGRKTASGFYAYGKDGRPAGPSPDIGGIVPAATDAAAAGTSAGEIVERIWGAIVNEAHRALDEGVARPADIDAALRLGAAHPTGPFERMTAAGGAARLVDVLRRHLDAGRGPRFEPADSLRATV